MRFSLPLTAGEGRGEGLNTRQSTPANTLRKPGATPNPTQSPAIICAVIIINATHTEARHREGQASTRRMHALLADVLARFPNVTLALLFGSCVTGQQRPDSDLDIAVQAHRVLTMAEKIALIEALAEHTGRPIDLIDLKTAAEPLLGQILRHGRRLLGSNTTYAQLISRHLFEQADFVPYRSRLLAERRAAWTGK